MIGTGDMDVVFDVAHFAQAVTFTPTSGPAVTFNAIFDDGAVDQQVGNIVIEATGPQLTLATADVPAQYKQGTYAVGAVTYRAINHKDRKSVG